MAKINLLPKKQKKNTRNQTPNRELRKKAYASTKWRKLRLKYLMEHPMCEECQKKPAVDIHHIKSFVVDGEIDWGLLLDELNLKALCKECHSTIHNKQQFGNNYKSPQEQWDYLQQLLSNIK